MKLHFTPGSAPSRAVLMFCEDSGIAFEPVIIDLRSGGQFQEPFVSLNPCAQVPVLEDGDFVLNESSAILRYLADKHDSPAYPKELRARARVNERLDWFNTSFYREWGYHLVYPQILPTHARKDPAAQAGTIEWGKRLSERWLTALDRHYLGPKPFLCGDQITLADYFGAALLAMGDLVGNKVDRFANVTRWMAAMRSRPSWVKVHEAHEQMRAALKGKPFVAFE